MTARQRIFSGLIASIYGRAVLVLGQILLVPVLVTRWGVAGYGEWVAVSALASYLSYTNVGMPGALRAHMAMAFSRDGREPMREAFQSSLLLIAAVAVSVGVLFIGALQLMPLDRLLNLHWMGRSQAVLVASVLGAQLVIYAVSSVFSAALSSIGRYPQAGLLDAHRQTFEFFAMLAVVGGLHATPGQAVGVYLLSWSAYTVAVALDLARHARWLYARPLRLRLGVLKELSRPMLGVLGMTFGYVGMSVQAPRIILAATAGPPATAVYALASMMMRMVRIPIDIPAHSATVEVSLLAGQGDLAGARGLLSNTTRICLWLALIAAPFVILLGPWFSHLWSNHRAEAPVGLLALMSVSTALFALSLPCQEGLMAIGQLHRVTKWLFAFSLPFVALCWGLSRVYGLYGASAAVVSLDLLYAVTALSAVRRFFEYPAGALVRRMLTPPVDLLKVELGRFAGRVRGASMP